MTLFRLLSVVTWYGMSCHGFSASRNVGLKSSFSPEKLTTLKKKGSNAPPKIQEESVVSTAFPIGFAGVVLLFLGGRV